MNRVACNSLKSTKLSLAAACAVFPLLGSMSNVSLASGPVMAQGIQLGDLAPGRAMVWSRSDRPARMMVEYAFNPDFSDSVVVRGPYALEQTDFTARQDLVDLPDGKEVYVKVWFEDLTNAREKSEPVAGRFRTIGKHDSIRFVWGGDTAGQGWGINESFGGEDLRNHAPGAAAFLHS